MPQWMYDWQIAQIDLWHRHPHLWWGATIIVLTVYLGCSFLARRR